MASMAALAFLFGLHSASAGAQEPYPTVMAAPEFVATDSGSVRPASEKSEIAATWLSTGCVVLPVITGTLLASHSGGTNQAEVGVAVVGVGLLLGPSAGYFYGGCSKRAWAGIGIRAGLSALALTLLALTPPVDGPDIDIVIGGVGLALVSLEGLYECFTVSDCVASHNLASRSVGVWVAPGPAPRSIHLALRVAY